MGKEPAFQFYPGDWIQDTRALSLAAKGAWIDLLSAMWRSQIRGQLTLSMQGYARLIGATVEQTKAVIDELIDMRICDFEINGNGNVMLRNRRMIREEKERESTRYRVKKWRNMEQKRECNRNVTPPSSTSTSSSEKEKKTQKEKSSPPLFPVDSPILEIFKHWQKAMNRPDAKFSPERERKIKARLNDGYTIDDCKRAINNCRASPYHMGENEDKAIYNDIELIFRNASKFERFLNLRRNDEKDFRDLDPDERRFREEIEYLKKHQNPTTQKDPGSPPGLRILEQDDPGDQG